MNILIPMAGAGSRFVEKGYKQHKPVIPTTDRRTGKKIPMVVAAVADLPVDGNAMENNIIFVVRDFHETDGVVAEIKGHYPSASFIVIDQLTEGQACTCLLARDAINNDEPLVIAACDNGMVLKDNNFDALAQNADAIIFTFRHNDAVTEKPQAYGWIRTEGTKVTGVSIKVPVSDTPKEDHAVVGTFWFKHGKDFVDATDAMIAANDRINNEFYVDQVFKYMVDKGMNVRVLEIDRYLCWGTPKDYEDYENTIDYWKSYVQNEGLFEMKLSVVIPCYNESGNIPLMLARLKESFGDRQDVEVLLVNNGSTDNSANVFTRELEKAADQRLRVVNVPVNKGYGYGILQGLDQAQGDVLAWTHADMQTDPKDALTAFDLWKTTSGNAIVKGKRQGRKLLETMFTFGMQVIASLALGVVLDDVNAQPKLFSRSFYETAIKPQAPLDFSLDLFLLYQAKKQGLPILTIPVIFAKRMHGEAKGGGSWKTRIKLIKRTFAYILELRRALR